MPKKRHRSNRSAISLAARLAAAPEERQDAPDRPFDEFVGPPITSRAELRRSIQLAPKGAGNVVRRMMANAESYAPLTDIGPIRTTDRLMAAQFGGQSTVTPEQARAMRETQAVSSEFGRATDAEQFAAVVGSEEMRDRMTLGAHSALDRPQDAPPDWTGLVESLPAWTLGHPPEDRVLLARMFPDGQPSDQQVLAAYRRNKRRMTDLEGERERLRAAAALARLRLAILREQLPLPPAELAPRQYSAAVDAWRDALRGWRTPENYDVARRAVERLPEPDSGMGTDSFIDSQVRMLSECEPAYVAADIGSLIEHGAASWDADAPLPLDDLPAHAVWFWLARPMAVSRHRVSSGRNWEPTLLCGFMAYRLPGPARTVTAAFYGAFPERATPMPFGFTRYRIGATVDQLTRGHVAVLEPSHDDEDRRYSQERSAMCDRILAALLAFCGQKVAVQSRGPIHRDVRRRLEREQLDRSEVRVVTLRKPKAQRSSGEHEPVEWSCHWLVGSRDGGHWRTLYRGTEQERRVWIFPYVKGNLDLPFKPPAKRLFAVTR